MKRTIVIDHDAVDRLRLTLRTLTAVDDKTRARLDRVHAAVTGAIDAELAIVADATLTPVGQRDRAERHPAVATARLVARELRKFASDERSSLLEAKANVEAGRLVRDPERDGFLLRPAPSDDLADRLARREIRDRFLERPNAERRELLKQAIATGDVAFLDAVEEVLTPTMPTLDASSREMLRAARWAAAGADWQRQYAARSQTLDLIDRVATVAHDAVAGPAPDAQ